MTDTSITFAGSLFEEGALSQQKSQRCGLLSTPGVESAPHHSSGTVARVNQDRAFLCEPLFQPTSRKEKTPNIAAVGVLMATVCTGAHLDSVTEVLACCGGILSFEEPPLRCSRASQRPTQLGQHPEFKLSAIHRGPRHASRSSTSGTSSCAPATQRASWDGARGEEAREGTEPEEYGWGARWCGISYPLSTIRR